MRIVEYSKRQVKILNDAEIIHKQKKDANRIHVLLNINEKQDYLDRLKIKTSKKEGYFYLIKYDGLRWHNPNFCFKKKINLQTSKQ